MPLANASASLKEKPLVRVSVSEREEKALRCPNGSSSWGATAVLGSPQVEQVAWEPPLSDCLTIPNQRNPYAVFIFNF